MDIRIEKKTSINSINNVLVVSVKGNVKNEYGLSDKEYSYVVEKIEKGDTLVVVNQYDRLFFQLVIDDKKSLHLQLEDVRKQGNKVQNRLSDYKIDTLDIVDTTTQVNCVLALLEGIVLGAYRFNKYFKKADDKICKLKHINVVCDQVQEAQLLRLHHVLSAVYYVRNMINEPVNVLNAESLADEILNIGTEAGCEVEVFNKTKIEALKMGGLLAVNKGSIDPPTFTVVEWKPANAINTKPYVLVGKGVVYDTGGLSLKPTGDSMDYMKSDMSGAATAAGVIYAIAKNKLPIYIIGLMPATDNRPSGNAYAPGDVIHMMDGTTVEMLNADAEGRMILADALTYAKRYDPELVINLATLTGSASIAIGNYALVAMGNASAEVKSALQQSAEHTFERIAEFPFWDDYAQEIKSDIADLKNIGGKSAGAITAGKFLEHFTSYPFMHFDIAGVAFSKKNDSYRGKGGTAFGLRLLYHFFEQKCIAK